MQYMTKPSPTEINTPPQIVEREEYQLNNRVIYDQYVFDFGDMVMRRYSVGFGFLFVTIPFALFGFGLIDALTALIFSGVAASLGIAFGCIMSAEMTFQRANSFDKTYSSAAVTYEKAKPVNAHVEMQNHQPINVTIGNSHDGIVKHDFSELLPPGWKWKQLRMVCRNVLQSGTFSEGGCDLSSGPYTTLRNHWLEYEDENGEKILDWKHPGHTRGGVKLIGQGRAIVHAIMTAAMYDQLYN